VSIGIQEFSTETIQDDLHPVWHSDEFQFQVNTREEERKTMNIKVFDENPGSFDVSLGTAFLDIQSLEMNVHEKKIIGLSNGGVGQVEIEVELVQMREYSSAKPLAPGSPVAPFRKRFRRVKPDWNIFEQEMVYDEEISNFLAKVKPASSSRKSKKAAGRPATGYQAKLAAYIDSGLSTSKPTIFCDSCGHMFMADAVFCHKCGAKLAGGGPGPGRSLEDRTTMALEDPAQSMQGTNLALEDESLEKKQVKIERGNALRCVAEEADLTHHTVFESVMSKVEIGKVPLGGLVRAAGPLVAVDGGQMWMAPSNLKVLSNGKDLRSANIFRVFALSL